MATPKLLDGLRICGFTHYVQGPAALQYLADMGADVIKIEPPDGAWERHRTAGGRYGGASATYIGCNRNVRSIAIDLKHPRARQIMHHIVSRSDVVAENYRTGVLDRLGFGYDDLRAIKPDLIYASATGWGTMGPMRDEAGQDLLAQARSGLIATTGPADRPTAVGTALVDQHAATLLALGILGAYIRKIATGEGCRVESNLLSAGLDLQMESIGLWFASGASAVNLKRDQHLATWLHDAPYGVYPIADGHTVISLGPNADAIADALDSAALRALGPGARSAKRDLYAATLAQEIRDKSWDQLASQLRPHGIWCEKVSPDFDAVAADPQVVATGAFMDLETPEGAIKLLAHPLRYDHLRPEIRHMAWNAGQDTRAILADVGLSDREIDALIEDQVVADRPAHTATPAAPV